jgi:hypothetical protein
MSSLKWRIRTKGLVAFPASEVVKAHWVAERRGLARFRTEQPPYSILNRGPNLSASVPVNFEEAIGQRDNPCHPTQPIRVDGKVGLHSGSDDRNAHPATQAGMRSWARRLAFRRNKHATRWATCS